MNRHPVDRMADIKAEIAALETEFAALREQVISGEIEDTGTEWRATVVTRSRRSIAVADAERLLPPALFNVVVRTEQQTMVTIYRLAAGRKKPPRRRRSASRAA